MRSAARYSILNANYMKSRLEPHFDIAPTNKNNRCAHEFIMDFSDIRKKTGIVEEDIAKRLQDSKDYGFHAPTMSWPVPHSLMIEPTESEATPMMWPEDKAELDRFCDAMISIRKEPHAAPALRRPPWWKHPYSREEAAFPAPWLLQRGKFWPTVARVDNSLGDRKLKLRLEE
eukprot:Skav223303  [mRNA]  locus=scaffold4198:264861:269518:- [translate_table: standard]